MCIIFQSISRKFVVGLSDLRGIILYLDMDIVEVCTRSHFMRPRHVKLTRIQSYLFVDERDTVSRGITAEDVRDGDVVVADLYVMRTRVAELACIIRKRGFRQRSGKVSKGYVHGKAAKFMIRKLSVIGRNE